MTLPEELTGSECGTSLTCWSCYAGGSESCYSAAMSEPRTADILFSELPSDRASTERIFSRLDCLLGFERHTIRGLKKMEVRVGIALVVLLSMALGRIRNGQQKQMRSLVAPARRAA